MVRRPSTPVTASPTAEFFRANRTALASAFPNSLIVLTAFRPVQRTADMCWKFEQDSSFWYFTGVNAHSWRLIIDTDSDAEWLVSPDIDNTEKWFDGHLEPADASKTSGVAQVISAAEAEELLAVSAKKSRQFVTLFPEKRFLSDKTAVNPARAQLLRRLRKYSTRVDDCTLAVKRLRAIKQPIEIELIQKAVDITIDAFVATLRQKPRSERDIEAGLNYEFRSRGARGHAYDPIIASGANACRLHYSDNEADLVPGELVLIDAGAHVSGYNADITRTLLPSGDLSTRQSELYEACQRIEDFAIDLCRPGQPVAGYINSVNQFVFDELLSLGLVSKSANVRQIYEVMPHAISHGLGLDVHDSLGGYETFQLGMVLTVEPGIYLPEEAIGIRIEDDILITASAPRNMSERLPSDHDELQHLLSQT